MFSGCVARQGPLEDHSGTGFPVPRGPPDGPVGGPAGHLRHGVVFEMQLNAPQVEQALVHMLA